MQPPGAPGGDAALTNHAVSSAHRTRAATRYCITAITRP